VSLDLVSGGIPAMRSRMVPRRAPESIHQFTVDGEAEHGSSQRLGVTVRDEESGETITDRIAKAGRVRRQ
jgi:hypothetical protein